ncbi:MAG: hypothetical protein BWY76_02020 [bacterium ADurb.Bin429]|nr:MAG: hypothetical protein BWY76_02020 [bacterium ADurb.Bin429]
MTTFTRFEDITAQQQARKVTSRIYQLAKIGPFAQDFRLRGQIQGLVIVHHGQYSGRTWARRR